MSEVLSFSQRLQAGFSRWGQVITGRASGAQAAGGGHGGVDPPQQVAEQPARGLLRALDQHGAPLRHRAAAQLRDVQLYGGTY